MHKLSVIYGTQNQAKIEYMKQLVSNLPVEIKGLSEIYLNEHIKEDDKCLTIYKIQGVEIIK